MSIPLRVLIVEDSEDDAVLLLYKLRRGGYDPTFERVDTPAAMKAALDSQTWDILIADYDMPHFSGTDALALVQEKGLDLPFIIVSGIIDEEVAVAAMRAGAHDYVMKDNLARLPAAIERELREAEVRQERKRTEEVLRESEKQFRQMTELSPFPVSIINLAGRYEYVNPKFTEVFGYTLEDIPNGKEWFARAYPDPAYRQKVIAAWLSDLERFGEYEVRPRTFSVTCKDGTVREIVFRPMTMKDRRQFVIYEDITERKRAEEQLQRYAAELEQANEEIKQFAYIVSHDLRTPLTNIKGFAVELRFALDDVKSAISATLPHLGEKQRQAVTTALREDVPEALGFIDSSVTRMDSLINAILKLSRLGRCELDLEPVDMNVLVQATLQSLAHQIEERQVKVTVAPLPKVVADRTSMEQIMSNILSNAVKYLDSSRPAEIEITAERDHNETTFHIRDNGNGIAKEDMDKVFAPFQRAGKQNVPGEGMGLSYVQALVRRHSGRIWCESEPGVGTTFSFTIPVRV